MPSRTQGHMAPMVGVEVRARGAGVPWIGIVAAAQGQVGIAEHTLSRADKAPVSPVQGPSSLNAFSWARANDVPESSAGQAACVTLVPLVGGNDALGGF